MPTYKQQKSGKEKEPNGKITFYIIQMNPRMRVSLNSIINRSKDPLYFQNKPTRYLKVRKYVALLIDEKNTFLRSKHVPRSKKQFINFLK